MTLQIWFWLCMFLWLIFGAWKAWGEANPYPIIGGHLLQFFLFVILGWQVFGAPVK